MTKKGKVLIDGDILAYRAAFATQDRLIYKPVKFWEDPLKEPTLGLLGLNSGKVSFVGYEEKDGLQMAVFKQQFLPEDATAKVDGRLDFIIGETVDFPFPSESDYQTYITGSTNFRFDIAKSAPYKGNRAATEKPKHLGLTRSHLLDKYSAIISVDEEADDLISKAAAALDYKCVVTSIDKDMLQLPCWHFNFVKGKWTKVDEWSGTKFFYTQILTGDDTDNIKGLHRVGPKTSEKMLAHCETEDDLWQTCVKAYDGDVERVLENARLLWLRRYDNELWEPPQWA
jgi:hypothetical protein